MPQYELLLCQSFGVRVVLEAENQEAAEDRIADGDWWDEDVIKRECTEVLVLETTELDETDAPPVPERTAKSYRLISDQTDETLATLDEDGFQVWLSAYQLLDTLKLALQALNEIPNTPVPHIGMTSYDLASKCHAVIELAEKGGAA